MLSVSYSQAKKLTGKPVIAYCRGNKKYYGVIQDVSKKGVLLQIYMPQKMLDENLGGHEIVTADQPKKVQGEHVFLGALLLPLTSLFGLGPLGGGLGGFFGGGGGSGLGQLFGGLFGGGRSGSGPGTGPFGGFPPGFQGMTPGNMGGMGSPFGGFPGF